MNDLLRLIRVFEGLRLHAYQCPAGVWTIGYGSTGHGIGPGLVWTQEQAEARMLQDAQAYWAAAKALCPRLGGRKLAAVADFAYNLGTTRLAGSTLRRDINAGRAARAAEQFEKWVFAGGRRLPGLILRRHAEAQLFLS
jgi:lysozyme